MAHRRQPSGLLLWRRHQTVVRCSAMRTVWVGIWQFRDDRYGRFQSHGHALQLFHRVHHERVNREISRARNGACREFS